jgi:hypothetical protein
MAWIKAHVGAWELGLLLAIATYILYSAKKEKFESLTSVLHMFVRLCFVIILSSGLYMLINWNPGGIFHLKALLGVVTMGLMEVALIRKKKKEPSVVFFASSLVLFNIVILIGYRVIG